MKKINLIEFKKQITGRPFGELIRHHVNRQNTQQLQNGCLETVKFLDERIQPYMADFIDKWNENAYDKNFYKTDCSDLFDEITKDAKMLLDSLNCKSNDETLFNMFQIIVLTYAYSASSQPKMQEFIGIKKHAKR